MFPMPARRDLPVSGQEAAVRTRLLLLAAWLAPLCGCARLPGPMPLPPQRGSVHPCSARHYLFFRDPDASQWIVEGISKEIIDDWRWARKRAVMRLWVEETQGIFFQAILTAPEEFLRAGGRKIDVRIAGRLLGSIPVERAGYIAWKQPVPEEWLETGREMDVSLEADAEWMQGNAPRSYILSSAGFTL